MSFFTQNTNGVPSILGMFVRLSFQCLWLTLRVCNHEDHVRIRKLVVHSFSDAALRDQEKIMTDYINLLITKLKEKIDGPEQGKVDMMSWYMFTTFDIMADLCFAEPFHALENGAYHPWMIRILNGAKNGSYVRMERAYPMLAIISRFIKQILHPTARLDTARAEHMKYSIDKTNERIKQDIERKDIITPVSTSQDSLPLKTNILRILKKNSEKGMSRAEIAQTLILLMTGGTEPTASGMSGVTYNLLAHTEALAKLTDEVRATFVSVDEINNVKTAKMPYLNAVINESLRVYPPVPARFPRRTGKSGDTIDGHVIPGDVRSYILGKSNFPSYYNCMLKTTSGVSGRPSVGDLPFRSQFLQT